MSTLGVIVALGFAAGLAACGGSGSGADPRPAAAVKTVDEFTPVTVSTISRQTAAVRGTDGRYHVVYELLLTNAKAATATVREIDVLDARRESRTIASFKGAEVVSRLRTLFPKPATDATIEPNGSRFFFIELSFRSRDDIPKTVIHHLDLLAADNPGATVGTPMSYTVDPFDILGPRVPRIGPPLRGGSWVASNGCCSPGIVHRGALQTVNGVVDNAQRFAIDWMRLDAQHRFVHGDPTKVTSYTAYGADVIAVADATVVETLDGLPDQPPGTLPDPASITLQTVDGNHVVLDLGNGYFAFYAHLKKGSVAVHVGDHVRRGQLLGKLGNSGNTSAPHLHFHVVNGPSPISSDGVPYTIDRFNLTGQIDVAAFDAATSLEGVWDPHTFPEPRAVRNAFPLDLNVVSFGP